MGADTGLFEPILTPDSLLAATSDQAWLRGMLAFEAELAGAQAEEGLVPEEAARAIAGACARLRPDAAELGRAARSTGNPVVPLLRALRDVLEPEAAGHLHLGATSQDVIDTAAMLVARGATGLIVADLARARRAAATLVGAHRGTLAAGRTLLQQAAPLSFGLRAAGWLTALVDGATGLERVRSDRLAVQLGGAVGTLAAFGEHGPRVAARLATRLELAEPALPWHTDRVRIAELACALGIAAGVAAKVALDVVLLAQTEVAEVQEGGEGRGGSSTMPHKRNPIGAVTAIGAARRAQGQVSVLLAAMAQEQERAAGAWHAEWQTLTDLLRSAGGAVAAVADVLEGLRVDPAALARNLEASHGLLLAERVMLDLAPEVGRRRAEAILEAASRRAVEVGSLRRALDAEPEITSRRSPDRLDALCDPAGYLGSSQVFIDRALAAHRRLEEEA